MIAEAFLLGAVAQISLLLAGLAATVFNVPTKVVGAMAGFGAGAMISAVSFDLVDQAEVLGPVPLTVWLLIGAVVFIVGDKLVERRFGAAGVGGALGIVIGSVVDGVPESLIFGIGVAAGVPVSVGFLGAVIISNVPQALAPSVDLHKAGWSRAQARRAVGGGRASPAAWPPASAPGWPGSTPRSAGTRWRPSPPAGSWR